MLDIKGHIKYDFNPQDIQDKALMLDDIKKNWFHDDMTGQILYSNSIYAKRHKLDQGAFKAAMAKVAPPADYNPADPASERSYKKKQYDTAVETIANAAKTLEYDIQNALMIKQRNPNGHYISEIHSTINQRFYENSRGSDAMSSKRGTREMRTFVMQGQVAAHHFFDRAQVARIKSVGKFAFSKLGKEFNDALDKMPPIDRDTIGMMVSAVINYYSYSADPSNHIKDIEKHTPAQLLEMYTPEIGMNMAGLGREYRIWSNDHDNASDNIKSLIAGVPDGELLAHKNLWADFANAMDKYGDGKSPSRFSPIKTTHVSFDDGNQNGIFLQGMFFGQDDILHRLGLSEPGLGDMRDLAVSKMTQIMSDHFANDPEKLAAWSTAIRRMMSESEKFASDSFKKAIMQNAYSKDASMFEDVVVEFLSGDPYSSIIQQELVDTGVYKTSFDVADEYNMVLEKTLRETVNQQYDTFMKNAGMMSAVLGSAIEYAGVDGDPNIIVPVEQTVLPDANQAEYTS